MIFSLCNKIKWNKLIGVALICLSAIFPLKGQQELPQVSFPSPNAYSIAKFVETPVNAYTGIPEVNIPIYKIKVKDLELGIALDYHAGGIKVNEVPGWVGSGWALDAGGVITRAVSGTNDDQVSKGFYYTGNQLINEWPHPSPNYLENHRVGNVDGMPDMFYFNFNGRSGKFHFDNNGNLQTSPYTNLRIELMEMGPVHKNFGAVNFGFNGFKKWKITDETGTVYFFEELELSRSNTTVRTPSGAFGDTKDFVTAWYLTKMVSRNGDNEIIFEYENDDFETTVSRHDYHAVVIGSYTYRNGGSYAIGGFPENQSSTTTTNYRRNLKKISFLHGTVEFITSTRNDLVHPSALPHFRTFKLDAIAVKDHEGSEKERVGFDYMDLPDQRLTLKKLHFNNTKTYVFDYDNMPLLPAYTSKSTDHWGYFNGASNNGPGLIPTFSYSSQTFQDRTYMGIDRNPHADKMKYGTLNRITWPTGGTTEFIFEPNDYSFVNGSPLAEDDWSAWTLINSTTTPSITFDTLAQVELWYECSTDGVVYGDNVEPCKSVLTPWNFNDTGPFHLTNYIPQNTGEIEVLVKLRYRTLEAASVTKKIGGGLRVAKIIHAEKGRPVTVKNYDYSQAANSQLSSGVSGSDFSYHFPFQSTGDSFQAFGVKAYSQSPFPLSATHGQHIAYQRVVESIEGKGKEIKNFTSFYDYPDDRGIQSNSYDMPLMPKKSNDYKRGKLHKQEIFDEEGNLIQTYRTGGFRTLESGYSTKVWESKDFISFVVQGNTSFGQVSSHIRLTESSAFTLDSESFEVGYEINDQQHSSSGPFRMEVISDYNQFHQLKSKKTMGSDGIATTQLLKYPKDYSSPSQIISSMVAKNVIGMPVETVRFKDTSAYEGSVNKWAEKQGGVFLDETLQMETTAPIDSFQFSSDGITFSPAFKRARKFFHDADQNISQINERGGPIKSYLWDYHKSLPVAAAYNTDASLIAYTSFETNEKGGWTYSGIPLVSATSRTGRKCYPLGTGDITKSSTGASATDPFTLTFWARRSSGSGSWTFMGETENLGPAWQLVQRDIIGGPVTISGTGIEIDELRLHPADAQMTTYTYDPLIGMTSRTDVRNQTVYYEYDGSGRLRTVRDGDSNILEHYEYRYASGN